MGEMFLCSKVVLALLLFMSVCGRSKESDGQDDYEQCENTVINWASSSHELEPFEDQKVLKDMLFFLHVPRTGGKNYFQCFLEQLYTEPSRCPVSYDKLRFDPRNPKCNLTVTHDDYSLMSKLPKDETSVVTIIRNPIDRVISSYEFALEVAARFLLYPNITAANAVADRSTFDLQKFGGSTLEIWPWKHLVPWMLQDLFARRDDRTRRGETEAVIRSDNPYDMGEILMPLHEFINDPIAWDLVHNGATFQVAGLTNNSHTEGSNQVRHCVLKHQSLGEYVLEVAKRRLDGMLYVGLTDKHKESASLFANVIGHQVVSKLNQSRFARNYAAMNNSESFRNSGSGAEMTAELLASYEICIDKLLAAQEHRRTGSMKFISPANFTKETRRRISERIIQETSSLNSLDMQLYEYAQQIFEKQKQPDAHKVMLIEMGDAILKNAYGASWKPLPFVLPFLLLLLFIFMFVNGRRRRSKSKV